VLRARETGLIPAVRPLVEAVPGDEFHISENLLAGILAEANELH
jgi:predicted nucleic acid-binding protein